jgi:transcriptional regulator with XRE-family HTH domain
MKLSNEGFGGRLTAIRKSRGLTQTALAKRLDKTRPAVGHWEAGRAFIRSSDLARVARALEWCRMRDLLPPPKRPPRWPRRLTLKRRAVVHLLARHEPDALALIDRITAPSGSVGRRAA